MTERTDDQPAEMQPASITPDEIRQSGLFDVVWYTAQNPDVAAADVDPLEHFLFTGYGEGRDPSPTFSIRRYFQIHEQDPKLAENPIVDFLLRQRDDPQIKSERYQPEALIIRESGFFDSEWYLANNPDVAAVAVDPIDHYIVAWREGKRDPSPRFSTSRYLKAFPEILKGDINPLVDFIERRQRDELLPDFAIAEGEGDVDKARSLGLHIIGWFADPRDLAREFTIAAEEHGKVLAQSRTGRATQASRLNTRSGFKLQLPAKLLDGQKHLLQLTVNGKKGLFPEIEFDGAELGQGFVDHIAPDTATGWGFLFTDPDKPAFIEFVAGDKLLARTYANQFRDDISQRFGTNGFQGFSVKFSPPLNSDDVKQLVVRFADAGTEIKVKQDALGKLSASAAAMPAEPTGRVDFLNEHGASGWALDMSVKKPIRIEMLIDGVCIGGVLADALRTDVGAKFGTDGRHGFHIGIPPGLGPVDLASVAIRIAGVNVPLKIAKITTKNSAILHHPADGRCSPVSLTRYIHRISTQLTSSLPLVSIIVINRNGSRHLKNLLESFLLYNSYDNYQIVIIDHGSTDDSEIVVKKFSESLNIDFVQRSRNFCFPHLTILRYCARRAHSHYFSTTI